ncbi:hypothetical protein [Pandoraea oxalativorans]|nr:hypothetical protein [Pandoraea oxalativorans]
MSKDIAVTAPLDCAQECCAQPIDRHRKTVTQALEVDQSQFGRDTLVRIGVGAHQPSEHWFTSLLRSDFKGLNRREGSAAERAHAQLASVGELTGFVSAAKSRFSACFRKN